MREKIIFGLITIILILGMAGVYFCIKKEPEDNNAKMFEVTYNGSYSPQIYYDLPDRYIYTHDMIDSIKFTYNNETKELSSWFQENDNFLDIFLAEIKKNSKNVVVSPYDGGSTEYHDGNIGIVVCHTFDNNINIVIGKNLDWKTASCGFGKKILVDQKAKNDKVANIIDKSTYYGDVDISCVDEPEIFYETPKTKYTFGCRNIVVLYESGFEETAEEAFKNGDITFEDLDKYNITYSITQK